MFTFINTILFFEYFARKHISFHSFKNEQKKKRHFVKFFVGKKLNRIPLLQNYPSLDEPKTEEYFVGETKDGFAHGRGKLFNHLLCDNLYIIDGEWKNGIIRCGKLYQNFGLHVQLVYKGEFNVSLEKYGKGTVYDENRNKRYEGDWKKNTPHGKGTIYHENGKKGYEGDFENGLPHGKCTLYYKNGNIGYKGDYSGGKRHGYGTEYSYGNKKYEGNWENGKKQGKGILYYENDNGFWYYQNGNKSYEGNFKNDQFHGKGTKYHSNGKKDYDGDFENGEFYGKGIKYHKNGKKDYEGDYKDNKWHGRGILYHPNGKKCYDGDWEYCKRHGKGIQYWENGNKVYEGNFENGKFQGKGIQYYENGNKRCEGHYKNGKVHGIGIQYHANGKKRYEGCYENSDFHGKGTEYHENGKKLYKGDFEHDHFHGKGTVYAEDGTIQQEGKFIRGQFFDETALMVQRYLETRNSSVLDEISVNEIQKYMETRFKMTIPDTKSKAELLEQLILLSKPSESLITEENHHEVKYDEFGNEIVTKCLGNDGNTYDIESMIYLFQKNNEGEYTNIPYHYIGPHGIDGERRPNFPIMGNGKRLDGYQIVCKEEV